MNKRNKLQTIQVLAIDLAKNSFHLYGVDRHGQCLINRKISRQKLSEFVANLPTCMIAMEACGGAHYWAKRFQSFGHEVKLMAPQFVKPYVKSNKNDALDAEAICEAVQRPTMRFVAVKTLEQQDIQSLHRMRSLAVAHRTAQGNQIRGLLLEYGLEIPKGRQYLRQRIPLILEDGENGLSSRFRQELAFLYEELEHLDSRIAHYDQAIDAVAEQNALCQLLMTIPGIGPKVASALIATVGDVQAFKNGRELSAFLGLTPRQHSTGGKTTLLGMSKRGDVYTRQLLIHGARSILNWVDRSPKKDPLRDWASTLKTRCHNNVAAVALANKMARTAYAVLKHKTTFNANKIPAAAQVGA